MTRRDFVRTASGLFVPPACGQILKPILAGSDVVSASSAPYWRVLLTGTNVSLAELKMRAVASGADLCAGGTVAASSTYDGSHTVSNAVDGNLSTFWAATNGAGPEWVRSRLVARAGIVEVVLARRAELTVGVSQAPTSFKLQYSGNGLVWSDVAEYSIVWREYAGAPNASQIKLFPQTSYSHWGIRVNSTPTGPVSLAEVQFRGTPGGANLCSAIKAAYATNQYAWGTGAKYAVDGNAATIWGTGTSVPHTWMYDFDVAHDIQEVALRSRDGLDNAQSPTSFTLIKSLDGETWEDVQTWTGITWSSNGQLQVFTRS